MWLFAMFDLPVVSTKARRAYTRFRKSLLKSGFSKIQFSVYARYFGSEEASQAHRGRIEAEVPNKGHVRLLTITDKQFGKMQVFYGKTAVPTEKAPDQLMLF